MRRSLTVHIPQKNTVSYSLYAYGTKSDFPCLTKDESEYIFKFAQGSVVVLFYTFQKIKRAFAVTGWQDERDGKAVALPGVEEKLCLIYTAKGYRLRILESTIKKPTECDQNKLFMMSLLFWYRLTNVIQYKKGSEDAVKNLFVSFVLQRK